MYKRAMVIGLATVLAAAPGTGFAEKPAPFPDFKAKRIKPPAPGERSKRITIQIDPAAQPAPKPKKPADSETAAKEKDKAKAKVPGRYSWFWEEVSPDMAQSGPGRLDVALRAISGSGKVSAPRLQALQEIAIAQGGPILRSTVGTSVSPALVLAVIAVESAGKSDAVSGAGAAGLMQLMPDTATRFGVTDRLIADQNIKGGVKYLNWLMREFDNDPILVLAGYNAGEGAVKTHQGVPPYAETRDYVPKVLAAFKVASGLCKTPPQLITDGCVFAAMN
ncbi:lytic transglycosylase domain-containing protein [Arenibacterium sp. CAU 1754]